MKMYLLSALALCLLPSFASAATHEFDYYATKDAGINGTGGEDLANAGAAESARAAKFRQHAVLMDFDWVALANKIVSDGRPLQSAQLRLSEAGTGLDGASFGIMTSYIDGAVGAGDKDWDEGDGTSIFANLGWSVDTYAAISRVPSMKNDGMLTTDGDQWLWGGFEDFGSFWNYRNNADSLANTADFVWPSDGVETTLFVDLDLAIIEEQSGIDLDGNGLIAPPGVPVGIYTLNADGGNNGKIYLRERAGLDQDPMIRLTFAPVPEPTSLGLLLIGGLGMLLRKRRS